jgi:hypothetical protein
LVSKANLVPDWLRILVTSRPLQVDVSLLARLRAAFVLREINAEDARNIADLRDYVLDRSFSPAITRKLQEATVTPEVLADWLLEKSGGKFLYVVHVLRDLAAGSLSVKARDSLPSGMDAFYQGAFDRYFGAHSEKYRDVSSLLGVMCCALEPMLMRDLAEILGSTEAAVEGIQAQLPHFVKLRGACLSFDHVSLLSRAPDNELYPDNVAIRSAALKGWFGRRFDAVTLDKEAA